MGWIIVVVILLAAVAVALGLARDASLAKRIGREVRDREDRQDPPMS
jgi:hypothetical protein